MHEQAKGFNFELLALTQTTIHTNMDYGFSQSNCALWQFAELLRQCLCCSIKVLGGNNLMHKPVSQSLPGFEAVAQQHHFICMCKSSNSGDAIGSP